MGKNKVIIAAAGWKGAGWKDNLAGCPESFLPLGGEATILSRAATIFAENDLEVYIAVGSLGYPYGEYVRWRLPSSAPQFGPNFPWNESPWTQERLDYAIRFGTVIEVPNPGGWATHLDTFCEAMDSIGEKNWDGLLLAPGDMIVPRECLEHMLTLNRPFSLSFTAYHSYFFFDGSGASFFRSYAEPFRRFATKEKWLHDKDKSPNHLGSVALKKAGFTIYGHDILPTQQWTDVDTMLTYCSARKMISSE